MLKDEVMDVMLAQRMKVDKLGKMMMVLMNLGKKMGEKLAERMLV